MTQTDVLIIGAGAAGLMCAIEAGKRGRRVVVLDHAKKPAEKIRISGGGRCNFTNLHTSPKQFLSANPHFCVSALSRFGPQDFLAMVRKHRIGYHEKTLGQLFCDDSSQQIITMLLEECAAAGVAVTLSTSITHINATTDGFEVHTDHSTYQTASLVVACGGLSIPKMGATGLGYDIARQFGLPIVPTAAALVPFTLNEAMLATLSGLSGVAADAIASCNKQSFREGMLFTHRGLSGPSILQISSYWQEGQTIQLNLLPDSDAAALLLEAKAAHPKQEVATVLSSHLPKRLVQAWMALHWPANAPNRLADSTDAALRALGSSLNSWQLAPAGTEGYRTAEVTRGGVSTDALSSKTMECKSVRGLYFIGEVVDVTGHLGGFNFQWAWASGHAAGQAV